MQNQPASDNRSKINKNIYSWGDLLITTYQLMRGSSTKTMAEQNHSDFHSAIDKTDQKYNLRLITFGIAAALAHQTTFLILQALRVFTLRTS